MAGSHASASERGERGGGHGDGPARATEGREMRERREWAAANAAVGRGGGMSPLLIFHFPFLFLFPRFPILYLIAI